MNTRWTLYLALFFVTISSVHAATLFESNWSTATGNDINTALLDGGIWDFWTCWGGIDQVMEVIPGNTVGWTATPNVMQFTQRGPSYCGSIQTQSSIPQLTDFYARMYIRTDEESGGWHDVTLNCCGSIQAALWSRGNYNSTHYRAKVAPEYSSTTYPYNLWFADPIPKYEWHRWEWYVDYVNSTNARIYTRVYDMDGNLLIDENSIRNVDTFQTTLAEWYAAGNTIPVRDADLFRRFGTSNPGQGGSPDTGLHWYNAGVKVVSEPVDPANNIWVGPIDGQSSSGPNIVWESDWSAALGTSEAALTDGGKWDGTGTDQGLLSVTTKPSGAPASWPENAMYVINDGGYQWSYISGGQWTMPAQGEYMFVRHLLYVDEGFNSWSGGSKPLQNAPGAISWIWPNPTGSGSLRFFGSGVAYFLPEYTMSTQTPYRAEIRLYNVPGSDLTYQIAVRWYDESTGMLIATEEDLLDNWGEGPGTLADHGPFTSTQSAEELWQNLRLGATSTTGANSRYWHTGIAVGISANADDWIGPYGETSTPPDNPPQDTTPPVATITAPSGGATLPEGTTSTTLSVSTNEPATCRYSTSDEAYVAMPNTLSGTGTTSHSDTLTGLTSGGFTYYVRCQDTTGNAMSSSTSVSFSVAQPQVSYDGDANSDGRVNIQDILLIVSNLGRTSFDARADRNSDGDVNVFDLVLVAKHFGREYEMTDQRLIAHYTFNEGSGSTVNDQSNNNHHGTIQGTPNWVTGVSGSALQLDGTTNYIAVPHSSGLSMTNEITLMAWVNTPGDDYDNIIVKGALGSAYGLFLYNLGIEHNLGAYTQTGELIPANTWTHIALTYDGSAIRVYRDGAQVSSTPRTGLLGTNTQTLHIGAATGSSPFAGMIDEVRLYNTALSQAEIQSIMSE